VSLSSGNPARPKPGAFLIALDALGDPEARAVDFREGEALFSVIVARRGELVTAYENDCPHARAPLERPDGRVPLVEGRFLLCTAHGASFRLEDGACAGGPAKSGLTPFRVDVRDGAVFAAPPAD